MEYAVGDIFEGRRDNVITLRNPTFFLSSWRMCYIPRNGAGISS
jgi:hypothetical protein